MESLTGFDHIVKLLLVGNSAVGKSCLLLRFCDDAFTPSFITTIGIDFKVRTLEVDGKVVKVQLWDTAGQERFRTITRSYYRGAHGVLLVYDLTDKKSFEDLRGWADSVSMHAPSDAIGLIVGNKADEVGDRKVGAGDATALAEILGMKAVETSAKSASGVEGAFTMLVRDILIQREAKGESSGVKSRGARAADIQLAEADAEAKRMSSGCC
ncbi:P-loop containing nucleoside triphosphate hydrolase protein [Piptocephalis cylindrospora]|uniref:P-loop containing nucleoside triphosphate hydrolase protein n=1 Tax=Piptocephalis cylindrospora TaxID=1907219 RepID=A0A4P9Y878_9FUNG|nr:P-loop containing nucleoside triphosphate hydrolase protein [Piptocephalis cylindrospora]|eukprot:RKP15225.1 P-loop containing nucleoside triphosphate hydrolase protein [Piptocephalis cylindrospora]